jgi:hypothetical protein
MTVDTNDVDWTLVATSDYRTCVLDALTESTVTLTKFDERADLDETVIEVVTA